MAWGEPVTRRRRAQSGTDRYGNPTYTTTDVVLEERAAFDPGGTREPVEVGREPVVTTPKLYFTERPDLVSSDVVLVRGQAFTVQGDPADWRDPWGSAVGGLVVELQRAGG
jgi:hypothetical protein